MSSVHPSPLTRDELKDVVREAIEDTFTSAGMDLKDPISLQKDMAMIRQLRLGREKMSFKLWGTVLGVVTSGMMGLLYITMFPAGQ